MTPELRVGCCGFPVARASYFRRFQAVEIAATFTRLPGAETARRWRAEAPQGFEFSVRAPRIITHPEQRPGRVSRVGHFLQSDEVREAWKGTLAVADLLAARFIVFETPDSFYPNADHFRDLYRFFKEARRGGASFVWDPRGGGWEEGLLHKVVSDLGLILAADPLGGRQPSPRLRYLRLRGRRGGRRVERGVSFTDGELRQVREACSGAPSNVFFGNNAMWRDAGRFQDSLLPAPPAWRGRR